MTIPAEYISKAADTIIEQLGRSGVQQIGGSKWWQWRRIGSDLKAEWIEMRADFNARKRSNEKSKRIMMYVHGGAYFFGSVDTHRYQLQRHARKLQARVFAPRYRLAPQFPFPCGLQDCLAAYLYLLSLHEPSEIVLAGDSAGGGMVLSIMCILRDLNLPLPAGGILISPWVDLTHSFPSVAQDNQFDYIPDHGFMQKPSAAWPPPSEEEMEEIRSRAKLQIPVQSEASADDRMDPVRPLAETGNVQGFSERSTADDIALANDGTSPAEASSGGRKRAESLVPAPNQKLSIMIDGKLIGLKDQIQMYTTNELLSHPLVSPVLQPSLGGLPPLLIQTGGGEILRDEQIYLAHKAANPSAYPLGKAYRARYDPHDEILHKYKPTYVQLQVWEDLCHVAPTLSFTRPAKFMYRSIAQFGAWALARAQNTAIEIVDDDNISVVSASSIDTDPEGSDSSDSLSKHEQELAQTTGSIGRAGDPLPTFKNHMIRQRVDRHGMIYHLAKDLPALQMRPDEVGVIKPGPARKWIEAKRRWDTRYASQKRKARRRRMEELRAGGVQSFGDGEYPPPSAIAGRRTAKDMWEREKKKKSYGLAMWSMWGSKHDEHALKREEVAEKGGKDVEFPVRDGLMNPESGDTSVERESVSRSKRRASIPKTVKGRSKSRRRTISVTDRGQAEGDETAIVPDAPSEGQREDAASPESSEQGVDHRHLFPGFIPKFKTAVHIRDDSGMPSDAASIQTGYSQTISDNASTIAVFGAPGVAQQQRIASAGVDSVGHGEQDATEVASTLRGYDTPVSRRSLERLMSHQLDESDVGGRLYTLRSPSSTAVVKAEGVIGLTEGGTTDDGGAGAVSPVPGPAPPPAPVDTVPLGMN